MKLKVYGWQGHWNDPRIQDRHHQVRCICAAPSMAAIKRLYGYTTANLFNICETGNAKEIETAMAYPLAVFAADLTRYDKEYYIKCHPFQGKE